VTAVVCDDVTHVYPGAEGGVTALRGVRFLVESGETVAICGPSGCGKSTLLSLITGLQRPTRGRVSVNGDCVSTMSERELLAMRARRIGIVVQNPARVLLPHSSPEDNISFARAPIEPDRRGALPAARALLDVLGLGALAGRNVGTLSGGEQQRVAVAVALANQPDVLVADEPTSQLDDANRDVVIGLLDTANREWRTTVVVVSHDEAVAEAMRRVIRLDNGGVVDDGSARRSY
jgi:ABC-type lipoprotein export system ATPase subunit